MMLNEAQRAAAHRTGQDVCVVAGPGSGKTRVLIERFAWLVREQGILPTRILAITFTEKAATEVKQRLVRAFEAEPEIRAEIERAYVSTIHGFCQRVLKENAIAAGLDPEFTVSDEGDKKLLLRQCIDAALEELYQEDPEGIRRVLQSLAVSTNSSSDAAVPDLAGSLMEIYDAMRTAGVPLAGVVAGQNVECGARRLFSEHLERILAEPLPGNPNQREAHAALQTWAAKWRDLPDTVSLEHFRVLSDCKIKLPSLKGRVKESAKIVRDELLNLVRGEVASEFFRAERALIIEALARMDRRFRLEKRRRSVLDFSDLEEQAIALLERSESLRTRVRGSFDQILMDELQDTNPLQWRLMDLLRRPGSFFAVGDVNQSIFSFRHAEPQVFHEYRTSLADRGLAVDELRTNYRTRTAVLEKINAVFNPPPDGIDPHRLVPSEPDQPAPAEPLLEVLETFGEDAEKLEAQHIAARILELDRPFSDIAILVRTYDAMTPISDALEAAGIPWVVSGGRTFFETREIRDAVALLKVIANPRDEVSLLTVLRSPLVGASDEAVLALSLPQRSISDGLRNSTSEIVTAFYELLARLRAVRDSLAPDRLLRAFFDDSDYESVISPRARANLDKFCSILRSYGPISLPELIRRIEVSEPVAEAPPEDIGNTVRLMTVHQSKGLEFPVVFVPALQRNGPEDTQVITFSAEHGLGFNWRDPVTRSGVGDPARLRWKAANRIRRSNEDNRLLYVALTRARDRLCVSFTRRKNARGGWWSLVAERLGVPVEEADNRVEVLSGVRVLRTDQAPAERVAANVNVPSSEPVFVAAPELREQHDSTASVTSISLYQACSRKYYLSRYLGWNGKPERLMAAAAPACSSHTTAAELGNQVHALLAGELVPDTLPEATALVDRFTSSPLGRRAAHATRIEREWDFLYSVEDVVLRGQIDLWFEHRGELIIVDYKTDQIKTRPSPERLGAYELQLRLYALALERYLRRTPNRAYLYFLRSNDPVEVDLSPLQLNGAREAVRLFREGQDGGEYPMKPGEQCKRCEFYRGICPARISVPPPSSCATQPLAAF